MSSFTKVLYFFPVLVRIRCVIFRRLIISREFHGRWLCYPLRRSRTSSKRKSLARDVFVFPTSVWASSVRLSLFLRDETPFPAESECDYWKKSWISTPLNFVAMATIIYRKFWMLLRIFFWVQKRNNSKYQVLWHASSANRPHIDRPVCAFLIFLPRALMHGV